MKKHSIRAAVLLVALAVLFGTAGCSLLGLVNEEEAIPLDAFLIFEGGTFETVKAHPQDANGLFVSIDVSENCKVNWGDKSALEDYEGVILHHYFARQGSYTVKASTLVGQTLKQKELYVVVENRDPEIADSLMMELNSGGAGMSAFQWRDNLPIPFNARVAGCNAAPGCNVQPGEFTYSYGTHDPDNDDIQFRVRAWYMREGLTNDVRTKWITIEEWAVFSLHTRELVSGMWAEIWGVWLQVGWRGTIPPWPFSTVSYESLMPREPIFKAAGNEEDTQAQMKAIIGDFEPPWPPCIDCDDPEPDPAPDPDDPGYEELGDCYMRIMVEAMDRFGGYKHKVWNFRLTSCGSSCDT